MICLAIIDNDDRLFKTSVADSGSPTAGIVEPSFICGVGICILIVARFDEVHFGGFAQQYQKGTFFLDVHPPGAKMLIAGLSWLLGLPEDFNFDLIGLDYLEADVPYVGLRLLPAVLGTLLVPVMFLTCVGLGLEVEYSIFGALLVLFENALTTQFRFVFLDAYLIFSSAAAICFYMYFQKKRRDPFSPGWWIFLMGTGICIGCASSCKWAGLFTVATVGLATLFDLWQLFSSPRVVSINRFSLHFLARFFALLVVPVLIYVGSFWMHFKMLTKAGPGASSMSLLFQQSLQGSHILPPTNAPVGYGSIVTIRHFSQKSFLHSHSHLYPEGSEQQQVTLYPFSDLNNEWIVLPRYPDPFRKQYRWNMWPGNLSAPHDLDPFVPLRNGDRIRLVHHLTRRSLHSHVVSPPLSNKEHHWEVSCYGLLDDVRSFGDTNDDWIIRITDSQGNELNDADEDEVFNAFRAKNRYDEMPIASQYIFALPDQYSESVSGDGSDEPGQSLLNDQVSPVMEQDQAGPKEQDQAGPKEQDQAGPNEQDQDVNTEHESVDNEEFHVSEHESQVSEHESQVSEHESQVSEHESQVSEHEDPLSDESSGSLDLKDDYSLGLKNNSSIGLLPIDALQGEKSTELNAIPNEEKNLLIDLDRDPFSPVMQPIIARRTFFKLVHANTGCSLTSFGKGLPDWAFHQSEVTCGRNTLRSHSVLVFETNTHPSIPSTDFKNVTYQRLGFWDSFIELHCLMWNLNKRLVAPHHYSSRPLSWPFLLRGIAFWSGSQGHSRNFTVEIEDDVKRITWTHGSFREDENMKYSHQGQQIHLIGNPLIWLCVSFAVFSYSAYVFVCFLKSQRYSKMKVKTFSLLNPLRKGGIAYSAYILHYLPFFFMGRQLYLHHYLTAYYFGILLLTILFRSIMSRFSLSAFSVRAVLGGIVAIAISVFIEFSPLTYGLSMSFERCERLRWFSTWDFDCSLLPSAVAPAKLYT